MTGSPPNDSRPRLPARGGGRREQRNATWLAMIGLLAAAFGLTLLVTMVITGFAPAGVVIVLLVLSTFAFVFGGHYLIWGVWLDRILASKGQAQRVEFWKRSPPPAPIDPDLAEDDE